MLTRQRKQHILSVLQRDGNVVAKSLSEELALSEDTIRRDLRELAAEGLLQRVHGGALPLARAEADFAGSTAAMADYVARERPGRVVLMTECSMSDNIAASHPEIEFVRPCNLCPHMKRITLANIRGALETLRHEVVIDPAVAGPARRAVERMLAVR